MSRTFYPQQPLQEMEFSSSVDADDVGGLVEFSSAKNMHSAMELVAHATSEMRERCAKIAENSHYWESPQVIAERIRRGK